MKRTPRRPFPHAETEEFDQRAAVKGPLRKRARALGKALGRGKNPFATFPKLLQKEPK